MQVSGLFAGVGGLESGLAAAGHKTLAVAEIFPPACAVLDARFDAPNLGDVTKLLAVPGDTELLTAGFPCQDLSQAGRTAGIDGEKSGLVNAVFSLLDRQSIPWVLLENVSFMLRLDGGLAMTRLVNGFEERGYRWAYRVINSLSFVPQRRERVFFLASKVGEPSEVLFGEDTAAQIAPTALHDRAHGFYWTEGVRGLGWASDAVPTLKIGSSVGIPSPPAIVMPSGAVITPDIRDAERLQGLPENWTLPAETVARSSRRWTLVGNAVTAPAAHWLGEKLLSPVVYDRSQDSAFGRRWPNAARFDGKDRYAVRSGAYPVWRARAPLAEFLRHPGKPLSARATSGFLSRTQRSSLRFPPGFLEAMAIHLADISDAKVAIAA